MRLHLSPFAFLRRHAWGLVVLFVLILAYFASIGWFAGKLRTDLGQTFKPVPAVEDTGHRSD